jgi:hypothetical protein
MVDYVCQWLTMVSHRKTLVNYGFLWLPMVVLDCDIPQWLCHIATFTLVDLCQIATLLNSYFSL